MGFTCRDEWELKNVRKYERAILEHTKHRGKRSKNFWRMCLENDKLHRFKPSRMAFVQIQFNTQEKLKSSEFLCPLFLKSKSLTMYVEAIQIFAGMDELHYAERYWCLRNISGHWKVKR